MSVLDNILITLTERHFLRALFQRGNRARREREEVLSRREAIEAYPGA